MKKISNISTLQVLFIYPACWRRVGGGWGGRATFVTWRHETGDIRTVAEYSQERRRQQRESSWPRIARILADCPAFHRSRSSAICARRASEKSVTHIYILRSRIGTVPASLTACLLDYMLFSGYVTTWCRRGVGGLTLDLSATTRVSTPLLYVIIPADRKAQVNLWNVAQQGQRLQIVILWSHFFFINDCSKNANDSSHINSAIRH